MGKKVQLNFKSACFTQYAISNFGAQCAQETCFIYKSKNLLLV